MNVVCDQPTARFLETDSAGDLSLKTLGEGFSRGFASIIRGDSAAGIHRAKVPKQLSRDCAVAEQADEGRIGEAVPTAGGDHRVIF